jgi:hypothetical protein
LSHFSAAFLVSTSAKPGGVARGLSEEIDRNMAPR